ncbi:MAG: SDR family NAD(P)-dependent oxidoreductase [Oscillospiraceae bacterium]|jgi:short-subunit dehydrogenase|nr:SDR family NAD(P)-dependent oxidoreductase [Oscillospiraceae bacterium]
MNIAIATGASSGIGREFARYLAEHKDKHGIEEIWLVARRLSVIEELAGSLPIKCKTIACDLTSTDDLHKLRCLLEEEKPAVRYLVNAAGMGKFKSAMNMTEVETAASIDLNVKAPALLTLFASPYMQAGSVIINMGSRSAFQPVPYMNIYAATKAFMLSHSRALGEELKVKGIRVICVCPYWVKSEFIDIAQDSGSEVKNIGRMWSADAVVRQAFADLAKGKDVSVLGFTTKVEAGLSKVLPHKLVMRVWERMQI